MREIAKSSTDRQQKAIHDLCRHLAIRLPEFSEAYTSEEAKYKIAELKRQLQEREKQHVSTSQL